MADVKSSIKILVLDSSENAGMGLVNLLNDNGVPASGHPVSDTMELYEALKSETCDILIYDEAVHEPSLQGCIKAIRDSGSGAALLVMSENEIEITAVCDALRKGAEGLVSPRSPDFSLLTISRVYRDLRERRQRLALERSNRELQERCQLLLSSAPDAVSYIHEGMHVYANAAYMRRFGFHDLDDVFSTPFIDIMAEASREEVKRHLQGWHAVSGTADGLDVIARNCAGADFNARLFIQSTRYEDEDCLQITFKGETERSERSTDQQVPEATVATDLDTDQVKEMLTGNRMDLVYQPVIAVEDIEPEFFEVEARLLDGGSDIFSPEQYRAVVRNAALGQKLDRQLIETAAVVMEDLYSQGQTFQFFFTVTEHSLHNKGFCDWLAELAKAGDFDINALGIMIRQCDTMASREVAAAQIRKLQERGIRVCITEFVPDAAVWALLQETRVRFVKLTDRLGAGAAKDPAVLESLKKCVSKVHSIKTKVIGGNVGDSDTLAAFWDAGVDLMQGAYFQKNARTLTLEAFTEQNILLQDTA